MTPHVLMFTTHPHPFGEAWAAAAARHAEVTTVAKVDRLSLPPDPAFPWLGFTREGPLRVEMQKHPLVRPRPTQLFRPLAFRFEATRIERVLDLVAKRRRPVDLLHSHFFAMWQLQRVARRSGRPLVHTEHSSGLVRGQPVRKKNLSFVGRRMAQGVYDQAAAVLPVSAFLLREMRREGFRGHFEAVPNPVDVARFRPTPLPVIEGIIRVGVVGRLSREKGHDVLLRAFAQALRREPRLRLHVVGRGSLETSLRCLVAELGIERAVEFVGFVPHEAMPAAIASFHLIASASRVETFGVAVAEGLASGRRAVVSDSGALGEMVRGDAGEAVPKGTGEVARLADALVRATLELGRVSPERVAAVAQQRCSYDAVGKRLETIYRRVLRQGDPG